MSDTDCGYTLVDPDGREEPCGMKTTGWRWYQDVSHEDCLEPACDWHSNEGGRRMAEMTDKLNAISEVLDNIGLYPSDRRAFEEIRAILDRPAAARAEPREDCPSCAGLGDVPCSHHKDRPNSQPESSRVLLGWTVPSHISWIISGGHVHVCCHWTKNVCSTTTSQQNGEWIGQFLRDHAHGQVVEHQPAADNAVPAEHPSCSCADADRTYSELESEYVKVCAERDLALWLHAESQWWLNQYMHDVTTWKREQDRLQASIDKALARHCKDADGSCRACGVDAYESPIPWPCETARILRGEDVQTTNPERCPSCDHLNEFHSEPGCWYSVTSARPDQNTVCACDVYESEAKEQE